jgi:tellurite resistance protein TehA-like permease
VRPFAEADAGSFAFVMATGIVSVAASAQGLAVLSDALLAAACLAWVVLAAAVSPRALTAPRRRPRLQSFALVAATAVVGVRFTQAGESTVALALWSAAATFWILLLVSRPEVGLTRGRSLLVVVATESLAVLAALLSPRFGATFLVVAFAAWLLGLALYPVVMRELMRALRRRRRFDPDLWIVMGALAITTLAGSELLVGARDLHALPTLRSWLPTVDLVTWAAASVAVVPLVLAELRARSEWRYEASRWSFVFPLGMFSVASQSLAHADKLSFLDGIGRAFSYVALAAWSAVLLASVVSHFPGRRLFIAVRSIWRRES